MGSHHELVVCIAGAAETLLDNSSTDNDAAGFDQIVAAVGVVAANVAAVHIVRQAFLHPLQFDKLSFFYYTVQMVR